MATLPTIDISVFTVIVGSYRLMRERVPYDACFRVVRYVSTCLLIRAANDGCSFCRCGHFHQPPSLAHSASRSALLQRYPPRLQRYPPRLQRYPPRLQRYPPRLQRYPPRLQRYAPRLQRYAPRLQRYPPCLQRWSAAWLLPVAIPSTWSLLCGGSASGASAPSAAHRGP